MRSFLFTLLLSLSLLNPSFSFSTKEPLVKEGKEEVIHTKQWTQQLGTSSEDEGYGVTVDSSDNIYVTGWTTGGLDGNTNSGGFDLFLVKYNSSGTKQWTQQLGTSVHENGLGVAVDNSSNIYVTGETQGELDGNTNSGDYDVFLVKYNSDGVKQ